MDTNGGLMDTYVVKCACTFRVQAGSAEEARQRALAQATAAGATSVEVDEFVLCLDGQKLRASQSRLESEIVAAPRRHTPFAA
jgi:hypothetical protein